MCRIRLAGITASMPSRSDARRLSIVRLIRGDNETTGFCFRARICQRADQYIKIKAENPDFANIQELIIT
jgi:hypothetical protein